MEILAKKIVDRWVSQGLVDKSLAEWCAYGLLRRLTTVVTLSIVVILGALFSNLGRALLFSLSLMYLRAFTNGHHSKTYWGCLFNSCLIEILGVLICEYLKPIVSLILACGSAIIILKIAPLNNKQIHFSKEELSAVRAVCQKRLVIILALYVVLLWIVPVGAYCIALALGADAFLLMIAEKE